MNLLDYIIVIVIILSAVTGFKRGFLKSLINFVGTIVVIILAFYLKNPISVFLYEHFPFFNLSGTMNGISVYNIIIYETISFLLTLVVLSIGLRLVVTISGIISKLTFGLLDNGILGHLLGLLFGVLKGYILVFFISFVLASIAPSSSIYQKSNYADTIVTKTPLLSNVVSKTYNSIKDVYEVLKSNNNKEEANRKCLEILLKYEIVTEESVSKLQEKGKINISNISNILNKYKEREE